MAESLVAEASSSEIAEENTNLRRVNVQLPHLESNSRGVWGYVIREPSSITTVSLSSPLANYWTSLTPQIRRTPLINKYSRVYENNTDL